MLPTVRPNSDRWIFAWNQLYKESDKPIWIRQIEELTMAEPEAVSSIVPWTETRTSDLSASSTTDSFPWTKLKEQLAVLQPVTVPPPPPTTTLFAELTFGDVAQNATSPLPDYLSDSRQRLNRLSSLDSPATHHITAAPQIINATLETHSISVSLPMDGSTTLNLSSSYYQPTTVSSTSRSQTSNSSLSWFNVTNSQNSVLSSRENFTKPIIAQREEMKTQNVVTSTMATSSDRKLTPTSNSSRFNSTEMTTQVFNVTTPSLMGSLNATTTTIKPVITNIQMQNIPNTTLNYPNNTTTRAPAHLRQTTRKSVSPTRRVATSKGINQQSSTPSEHMAQLDWVNQVHYISTPPPYNSKRDCGIRTMKREGRVVGGRDSHLGEFPWSVLIRETTLLGFFVKTKCGGVLIDLKWVLTAAHCQPGMFGSLVVVVGEYDLQGKSTRLKPMIKKVKRMIIHRDYNPSNFDNDIALLELESPYQVQPHVVPICLPEKGEEFIGQPALVAGWGKLSFGGPVPSVLQVAKLPVIGNKQCQEMYHDSGHMKIISDSFLCAGYANGGQDSCEGDSGGPLQVQRNDSRWVLVGTVSHGIKCAEPNLPGIYIRTAAYLPWIRAVTYHQDTNKRYGHRRQFHIH